MQARETHDLSQSINGLCNLCALSQRAQLSWNESTRQMQACRCGLTSKTRRDRSLTLGTAKTGGGTQQ